MENITQKYGNKIYQYSTTAGLDILREYIVERYKKLWGMEISLENVIITTGSQQALDLIGKVFINEGDKVLVEKPSYLGLLQAFCMYNANFVQTKLNDDGLDIEELKQTIKTQTIFRIVGRWLAAAVTNDLTQTNGASKAPPPTGID